MTPLELFSRAIARFQPRFGYPHTLPHTGRGNTLKSSFVHNGIQFISCFILMDECRWTLSGQVTADSFVMWRNGHKAAVRTKNHYLQGMVSFLNWLEKGDRIKSNPLKNVGKIDERGQKKRVRRAFTDEELRKLIKGSGPRGIIYFTAARTGLRREELKQLTWGDVHLGDSVPHVVVRAETAKNKKQESVCLVPEIVDALKAYRPKDRSAGDLVFPNGVPQNCRLIKDTKRNGIVYQDASGRFADFHSLRYTWATFLQRNGVAQRFAMKLMRHSDIKLTAKVYTDETQLPIYDSIKNLPRLSGYTQIRAQISGAEGQNVAQADAKNEGAETAKPIVNGGGLSRSGAFGRRKRSGAGEGNRTLVWSLENSCSTIELHPPACRAVAGGEG